MRSRTPRAAGPRAVDRARSRVRRARLARSSGTPRASNARDSRAFRRVRSSSADAEASARAVARSTFASRIAPPTGIVLDDAMSAWAALGLKRKKSPDQLVKLALKALEELSNPAAASSTSSDDGELWLWRGRQFRL